MRALATEGSLADDDVLVLAAEESRILVTRDSVDFTALARDWAEAGRSHTGVILIWTLETNEHAAIVRGIGKLVAARPNEREWRNLVLTI